MRAVRLVAVAVLLAALGACTGDADPPASEPRPAAGSAAERTLASLRTVDDDLPMYAMTYVGDYDATAGTATPAAPTPFGCSLFSAPGGAGGALFGRNFDWEPNPALVLHTDPSDGYASVSIVDISYLGVASDPTGDPGLLDAPLLPFDGMNERGLFVGLAADESATLTPDPAKPTVGGVRIIRLVLDAAATVDEALGVFGRHNLDFDGGPPLHYLVADPSGASAVVEFVDGRMSVVRGAPGGQALTNIRLSGVPEQQRRLDRRYAVATAALERTGGVLDRDAALRVLRDVAQPHTRWSVVYEPRTGAVSVVAGQRWEKVHDFRLAMD
jgi:choloylglycine hydrolase